MLRQMTALILALLLVVTAVPVALAATGAYSAHTPLSGADSDKLNKKRQRGWTGKKSWLKRPV